MDSMKAYDAMLKLSFISLVYIDSFVPEEQLKLMASTTFNDFKNVI